MSVKARTKKRGEKIQEKSRQKIAPSGPARGVSSSASVRQFLPAYSRSALIERQRNVIAAKLKIDEGPTYQTLFDLSIQRLARLQVLVSVKQPHFSNKEKRNKSMSIERIQQDKTTQNKAIQGITDTSHSGNLSTSVQPFLSGVPHRCQIRLS
jgi:hypothetical protein